MNAQVLPINRIICTLFIISVVSCSNEYEDLTIFLNKGKNVTPIEYGWHYEEIGMIGDGGLYAEMVRNRGLEEANPPRGLKVKDGLYVDIPNPKGNPRKKVYTIDPLIGWSLLNTDSSDILMSCVNNNPLNTYNPHSLEISVKKNMAKITTCFGVVNTGFFGMNLEKGIKYNLSFSIRTEGFIGPLEILLIDGSGKAVSENVQINDAGSDWMEYAFSFIAKKTTRNGQLL